MLHIFKFLFCRISSTISLAPIDPILSILLTLTTSGLRVIQAGCCPGETEITSDLICIILHIFPTPLSRIIIRFWETAHLPLPQANINTHISVRANLGLRGGVGGQTGPRNVCDVLTEENANFCPNNRFRPGVLGLLKPF